MYSRAWGRFVGSLVRHRNSMLLLGSPPPVCFVAVPPFSLPTAGSGIPRLAGQSGRRDTRTGYYVLLFYQ